jgi:hypothetical protein
MAAEFHAAGAAAIVTTEKDAVNLCQDCDDLLRPLPLYSLRIAMEMDGLDEFMECLETRLNCIYCSRQN